MLCTIGVASAEGLATAYGAAVVEQQGSRSIAILTINGKRVLKLYNPQGGTTSSNLLSMLADSIPRMFSKYGNSVTFREDSKIKNIWYLCLGDQQILIANASEAAAQGKTASNLVRDWADNLSLALNSSPISVKQNSIRLNVGETYRLAVNGSNQYQLTAFAGNQIYFKPKIINPSTVEIIALRPGNTSLVLSRKNLTLRVPVEITNEPIPIQPKVVEKTVAAEKSIEEKPKDNQKVDSFPIIDNSKYIEETKIDQNKQDKSEIKKPIIDVTDTTKKTVNTPDPEKFPKFESKGHNDLERDLKGVMINSTLARFSNITDEDRWLFYSNDPETVFESGILYAAELPAGDRSRIFFHHLNRTQNKQNLYCSVINIGTEPINLSVKMGVGGGHPNAILTGYASANNYLRSNYKSILIEPNKLTPLSTIPLLHGSVCTGLLSMYAPRQTKLRLVISMGQAPVMPPQYINPRSNMYFENPVLTTNREVSVGYRWDFLKIGHIEKLQNSHGHNLHGNYGVTYRIQYKIKNPTSENMKIELALLPSGGAVKMPFRINGLFYESDMLRGGDEPKGFATFILKAGETKRFTVETIPVGGAWYPATIVVRKYMENVIQSPTQLPNGL